MQHSKTITLNPFIRRLFNRHAVYIYPKIKDKETIVLQYCCRIEPYTWINRGNVLCTIGAFSYSCSPLDVIFYIGRYVSIAGGLSLIHGNHPYDRFTSSSITFNELPTVYKRAIKDLSKQDDVQFKTIQRPMNEQKPITIGHDVWIGSGVTLKPGIMIGQGAVIAEKSLVTKDVPPYSIWGGVPARQLKMRFDDRVIERLFESQWWEYAFPQFTGLNILDPLKFCEGLDELKAKGLKKFEPEPLTFDEIAKCYEGYEAFEQRITKARNLASHHWILRRFIKMLVDKKRYKKLKTDPDRFFDDSKSWFIRQLGRYYN